jgi:hypothetical protein
MSNIAGRPTIEPPAGPGWIHEIKHDGFRILARREAVFTRHGTESTARSPKIASAVESLPFGAGLGVGTQGTQHFGGGGEGAAEGGLGKITLELGVPGLFIMGWVAISLVRYLWRIMRVASRHSQRIAQISFGLFSFLVANAAAFSVATQGGWRTPVTVRRPNRGRVTA